VISRERIGVMTGAPKPCQVTEKAALRPRSGRFMRAGGRAKDAQGGL